MEGSLEPARNKGEKSRLARCMSRAAWLFSVGEVAGLAAIKVFEVNFPDAPLPPQIYTHAAGVAFGLVGLLTSLLSRRKPLSVYHNRTTQDLAGCIADAEMMFVRGMINDRQRAKIIDHCMEKFMAS